MAIAENEGVEDVILIVQVGSFLMYALSGT